MGYMNAAGFVRNLPRTAHTAELFRDGNACLQAIFVEACAKPRPTKPRPPPALQGPQARLGKACCGIEDGVIIKFAAMDQRGIGGDQRVQRDEQVLLRR